MSTCGEAIGSCNGLVFGATLGILNASLTTTSEILRHEQGSATGLICDCEALLRTVQHIRIASELNADALPLTFSAAGFTTTGTAVLTSYECTWSREAFVQHTSSYELIANPVCTMPEDPDVIGMTSCPAWSTNGDVVNATYTRNVEVLKYEQKTGTGSASSPLLQIVGVFSLRKRFTLSVTFDRDPGDQYASGTYNTLTVSSASTDPLISVTKSAFITSVERTCQKEGWTTWTVVMEGLEPACSAHA
jgi:hypothetical protein